VLDGIPGADSYIDDVLIHTPTWQLHLDTLRKTLESIRAAGLTIRPSKCVLGTDDVTFVGHHLEKGVIRPGGDKMGKVQEAARPTTKKEVRSFLGLVGFYRTYIPNFATIAEPLTALTKKFKPNHVEWTEKEDEAFIALKGALEKEPILKLPDPAKPYIVRTDASDVGIGAILLQDHGGVLHPVAYASRQLLSAERNYSAMERECLALVWAITKKFRLYLYGNPFEVQSDHQPLSVVAQKKTVNARVMRWSLALQDYDFVVKHIKGATNFGADYLSRVSSIPGSVENLALEKGVVSTADE
jgi:hypothetical protein